MTGKQNAVLWMGLILILLNVVSQWPAIKAILFTDSSPIQKSSSGSAGVIPTPIPGFTLTTPDSAATT
jgi:hypothetical protein